MIKKPVYFDHAATTPVDERVLKKMLPYFSGVFGNAASSHAFGREAVKAVDEARDLIAGIINCKPNELYFTSGGTESDNWALRGVARANGKKGDKIIISPIEHAAVIETAKDLEKDGFVVEYMKVDTFGRVDTENLKSLIDDRTILICCMAANNEVGTIEPIKEIVKIAKERGIFVFTDAVQAAGVLKIDVKESGVDLMSMSSHKIYGPKGAGALYVREGVKIAPLVTGGQQENRKRGGTTNVPAVVGFAEAMRIAESEREKNFAYVSSLRDRFIERVEKEIPQAILNGDRKERLPANADFSFKGIDGEALLFNLDLCGIAASAGSACSSGSLEPSHVLLAMGKSPEEARGSIRFTFGKDNTLEEIDYCVDALKEIVGKLAAVPLFKKETTVKKA